jgi:hypothetical protein
VILGIPLMTKLAHERAIATHTGATAAADRTASSRHQATETVNS